MKRILPCLCFMALLVSSAALASAPEAVVVQQAAEEDLVVLWKGGPTEARPDLAKPETLERIVRTAYDQFTLYANQNNRAIQFQLDDFRTYSRDELHGLTVADLITAPGGRVLRVERQTIRGDWTEEVRVQYIPRWTDLPQYALTSEGSRQLQRPASEVLLEAAAKELPALDLTAAVTTFHVTVTYTGESRSYRAAFVWIPRQDGLAFFVTDHVTDRIRDAVREAVLPGTELPRPQNRPRIASNATCKSGAVLDTTRTLFNYGQLEHNWGQHEATATPSFHCRCQTNCSQIIEINNNDANAACNDWGEIDGWIDALTWHVMSSPGTDKFEGTSPNGHTTPATGNAAVACSWQTCFTPWCASPSVSVSWNGFGFSTSAPSGGAAFKADLPAPGVTCPKCVQEGAPRKKRIRKVCRPCGSRSISGGPATNAGGISTNVAFDSICEDVPDGDEGGFDTCEEAEAAEPDPDCGSCDIGCNFNGFCEAGETSTTCPDCTSGPVCNFNFSCEPFFGENAWNCVDCQATCIPCQGMTCGTDIFCGNAFCGTCTTGFCNSQNRCESTSVCDPCSDAPWGACGTFWSSDCGGYRYCDCADPSETCVNGQCVYSGGGGDPGGGDGLPDRWGCNCYETWDCDFDEWWDLFMAECPGAQ